MSKPTTQQIIAAIQAEVASPNPLIGRSAEWPEPSNAFEIIQLDEDADGNGGLTLGWNSNENHVIPAGTKVGEYVLMEPYFPQDNGGGKYRYEPKFSDPVALLEKTPFIFKTMDAEGDNLDLFTFPFTGLAGTIIGKLQDAIRQALGDNSWLCVTGQGITASITVDFDGDTLKSAAQKIAQACGCTLHYTWKQLNFGTRAVYGGNEFYNRFIVFGGTTNMSRKIVSGQYTSVVKRLTLNLENYPDSVIDLSNGGTKMTKLLVFDDIYPKMELIVDSVYPRPCFLLDENGNKIPDGGYEVDGNDDYILDENGDRIPTYKKYTKWYVKLRYSDGTPFTLNNDIIIVGQTLKLLFQPDYDIFNPSQQQQETNTSPLAGRSFEVVYFDTTTKEYEADDVNQDGYTATEGWFRIIFTAEGETIIPTNPDLQLVPKIGNKVTLINVALTGNYVTIAQGQLLAAAQAAIGDFANVGLGGKAIAYPPLEDEVESDDSTEQQYPLPDVGGTYDNLFVSSKTTDLITGRQEISYGTFGERSLITSMIDKIDNAQTSGGGGTTKSGVVRSEEENTPNGQNRKTLQEAGGNLGVKTVTQYFNNQINGLIRDLDGVHDQVDQKIDMWFYKGVPYPNEYAPTHAPNVPVSEWDVDDYELHEQDLYYDTSEVQDQYESSMVWRWEKVNVNGTETWLWKLVADAHTIDAMDKIYNVSSDGILSAGAEKVRVYLEWRNCVHEYFEYTERANDYGITTELTNYVTAFTNLGKMLNGGANINIGTTDVDTPSWLSNLAVNTTIPDTSDYKAKWEAYYAALTALLQKIQEVAKSLADAAQTTADNAMDLIGNMGSDSMLDPSEKLTVKREFIAHYHEMMDTDEAGYQSGILDMAKDDSNQWIINYSDWIEPYLIAFRALGTYLNGGTSWTEPTLANFGDATLPSWIQEDNMSNTNTIDGDVWRNLWADFYTKRTAVLTALSEAAHNAADIANTNALTAIDKINDMANDGKLDPSEKLTVKRDFLAAWNEKDKTGGIYDKCYGVSELSTIFQTYVTNFTALGTFLNNGTKWSAGDSKQNDSYRGTDSNLPSWLQGENMSSTNTITGSAWRTVWSNFYTARTAVLTALSQIAKDAADNAQAEIDKIVDDGIITAGSEKARLLTEWKEVVAKYGVLKSLENVYPTQFGNYKGAIRSLASMLDGQLSTYLINDQTLNNFLAGTDLPDWLDDDYDVDIEIESGGYTPAIYRERWANYYAALEALTNSKASIFVISTTDNPNHPVPPYKVGDMWIIPDQDNKTMICVVEKTANQSYSASDWKEMSAEKDYRMLLAVMVEQCYLYNNKILPSGWHHFSVYLTTDTTTPSTLSDKRAGSILFMPNASQSSKRIQYYYYSQWNEVSDEGLYDALNGVYEAIVEATEGTVTFNVYSSKTNAGNNPQENSLVARELTYSDPVTNEDIKGGLDVLYYNGSAWELLSKATSAAIENLGNAVRMVVFGNEDFGDSSAETFGSGAAFTKALGMMFSEVVDSNGDRITGAYIATYVQQGQKNVLESGITISADNIEIIQNNNSASIGSLFTLSNGNALLKASKILFQGETFAIDAGHINIGNSDLSSLFVLDNGSAYLAAGNIKFDGETIDLTGANISLNAEQIDFTTGSFIIQNPSHETTFEIDTWGDVYISGTITATGGYIGGTNGWIIDTNRIYKGTIGTNESMHLATQDMTATINGISYSTLRLSIGSKFGVLKDGKLVASGASVSGTFINGDFNESTRRCTFGVVIQNEAAFTSPRPDYLTLQYGRGGLFSVFARNAINVPSKAFRGIYCEGEVEIQGVTQILKPVKPDGSQPDTPILYALITEGVDNRGDSVISGDLRLNGKSIYQGWQVIGDSAGTIAQTATYVVANRNGDQDITVPSSGIIGQIIRIKKTNSGWCYIKDGSGNTINQIAFDRASVFIVYDGTKWI